MKNFDQLGAFGKAAVLLDFDFTELERLGGQLERLDLSSPQGLEHSLKILAKFGEHGEGLANHLEEMAQALAEARVRTEEVSKAVGEKAMLIQKLRGENQGLWEKFKDLGEKVRVVSDSVAEINKTEAKTAAIENLTAELKNLFDQTCALRSEAHEARMKELEKNAHALSQVLQTAQKKLQSLGKQLSAEQPPLLN